MIDGPALLVFYTAVGTFQQGAWELVLVLAGSPGRGFRTLMEQTFHRLVRTPVAGWPESGLAAAFMLPAECLP
jgi:hypothetical protein